MASKKYKFLIIFKDKENSYDWKFLLKTTVAKTDDEIQCLISYFSEISDRNIEGYSPCDIMNALCEDKGWSWEDGNISEIAQMVNSAPTVSYSTRHWINQNKGAFHPLECPKCHREPLLDSNGNYVESKFCPFCGWEMSDKKND